MWSFMTFWNLDANICNHLGNKQLYKQVPFVGNVSPSVQQVVWIFLPWQKAPLPMAQTACTFESASTEIIILVVCTVTFEQYILKS